MKRVEDSEEPPAGALGKASQESEGKAIEAEKELGLPSPSRCRKCGQEKCGEGKAEGCCGHDVELDEFRIFFLGIIFHELSHLVAAKLAGVRVISYRLWHPQVAWVRVQDPKKAFNDAFISFAPLLFGSIASSLMIIFLFSSQMWSYDPLSFYLLLYIAVSIAVCSPISRVDSYALAAAVGLSYLRRKKGKSVLVRLTALLVWPFYFIAASLYKLSRFWFALVQYVFLAAVFALLLALLFAA
jgi:hypothetical protein